jgi:hypothetical protein
LKGAGRILPSRQQTRRKAIRRKSEEEEEEEEEAEFNMVRSISSIQANTTQYGCF